MNERKLASIQKIIDIQPIEGADKIELATILGWHVVTAKENGFKAGDKVVYFEVDSLLPVKPEYEFLARGSSPKKILIEGKEVEGYRLKTIRLRGQISQGLVMPLSIIPESFGAQFLDEGADVTEHLNVYKYEVPMPAELAGKARGGFPGFIPRTDETRLQSVPSVLETYKEVPFFVTEKVDGSSCTFFIKNDEFHACGRTIDWMDDGANSFWQVAKELDLEKKMREFDLAENVALQGEILGPKIQQNTLKLSKPTILFYNAYDFANGVYLDFPLFVALLASMEIATVPIISSKFTLLPTVDEMVKYATAKSIYNPDVWLEGMVFRPLTEVKDPDLGRLSFKVINPEYQLKHDV